jgi:toxin ParE1/3/4
MAVVGKHARARRDLVEHYIYLAENGSAGIADRFLARAEESFRDLARHPEMGVVLSLRPTRLAGMRKWRVNDFENFLIFYQPRANGVSIVRILHAAQDWWGLLGIV